MEHNGNAKYLYRVNQIAIGNSSQICAAVLVRSNLSGVGKTPESWPTYHHIFIMIILKFSTVFTSLFSWFIDSTPNISR